ncbi:MAG: GntR family transcriptional regulator, partial [Pseudomonadota bacterium]
RHWAGARVFQHEDRWINVALAPAALAADFAEVSANEWLLEHVPYSCVDHEITARVASAREAEALGVSEGAALLRVRRLTHWAARRVTYAVLTHPGDLFALRSEAEGYSL